MLLILTLDLFSDLISFSIVKRAYFSNQEKNITLGNEYVWPSFDEEIS